MQSNLEKDKQYCNKFIQALIMHMNSYSFTDAQQYAYDNEFKEDGSICYNRKCEFLSYFYNDNEMQRHLDTEHDGYDDFYFSEYEEMLSTEEGYFQQSLVLEPTVLRSILLFIEMRKVFINEEFNIPMHYLDAHLCTL